MEDQYEDDDDDDDDDIAEHQVEMYLTNLDESGNMEPWHGLDDVVPFFSVPKNGRHVFYTAFLYPNLLAVGANIGSDIALIDTTEKQILELPEGANATTPTTEDDEFTFPIGLTTCHNALYVMATDGSTTQFELRHVEDETYFEGFSASTPIEIVPIAPPSSTVSPSKPTADTYVSTPGAFSTVDSSAYSETPESRSAASSVTPFEASTSPFGALSSPRLEEEGKTPPISTITTVFGAGNSAPSFGSSTPIFGAGNSTPSFGFAKPFSDTSTSGKSSGITFGQPKGKSPFIFGVPTPLGLNNPVSTPTSSNNPPTFGSGTSAPMFGSSGKVFGENFSRPQFGQLASGEKKGFGSPASNETNPFGAFGSKSFGSTTTIGGPSSSMVKPLFSSPEPAATTDADKIEKPETPKQSSMDSTKSIGNKEEAAIPQSSNPIKERLIAIYKIHNPDKIKDIDKLLKKYDGRESEMFAKIAKVYNLDKNDNKITDTEGKSHTERLIDIYTKKLNKPEKLKDVDKLLKKYKGKEDAMFQRIREVYKLDEEYNKIGDDSDDPHMKIDGTKKLPGIATTEAKGSVERIGVEGKPGAKTAASAFDSIDERKSGKVPTDKFEELLDEVGEGFYGDEFDAQLKRVDLLGTQQISRAGFISWYCSFLEEAECRKNKGGELDEEEQEERDDETKRAREVFKKFSEDGGKTVHIERYPKFMKGLGTTYDGEGVHGKAAAKMKKDDGSISWDEFIKWYIDYLFGDDDEEENSEAEDGSHKQDGKLAVNQEGWGNIFDKPKDSWKCDACMVQNTNDTAICVACEAIRPGFEEEAKKEKAATSTTTSSGSTFSFGTTSAKSTGFTFGQSTDSTVGQGNAFGSSAGKSTFSFGATGTAGNQQPGSSPFGFGSGSSSSAAVSTNTGFSFGSTSGGNGFTFGSGSGFGLPKKDDDASRAGKENSSKESLKATAIAKGEDVKEKSSAGEDTHRIRLENFYKEHKPEKLKDIDKLLRKFQGREEEMFKRVEEVYKIKVPPAPTSLSSSSPAQSKSASSYPPMSSICPSSDAIGKKESSSQSSSASGYPPVASEAPKNAFGGKESSGASISKSSAGSGYPPMAKEPAASSTAKGIAGSGYPPMASQAPSKAPSPKEKLSSNPFGFLRDATDENRALVSSNKTDTTNSKIQPTTIVQKQLTANYSLGETTNSSFKIPSSSSEVFSNKTKTDIMNPSKPAKSEFDDNQSGYASEFEEHFAKEMKKFQESISSLSQPSKSSPESIEQDLKYLVESREKMWNKVEDFSSVISDRSDRALFLISRKPDLERQVQEGRRCVQLHMSQAKKDNVVSDLSLDAGSERMRRKLAATAIMIPRYLDIIKIRCGESEGKCGVLNALKSASDQSTILDQHSDKCSNKVRHLSGRIARSNADLNFKPPVYRRRGNRIAPDSAVEEKMKTFTESQVTTMTPKLGTPKWKQIDLSLETASRQVSKQTKITLSKPILGIQKEHRKTEESRSYLGSQLLSPAPKTFDKVESLSAGTSVTANLFSPLPDTLTSRADWDSEFTMDQLKVKKLSFNLPKHLNEVKSSDAVREALTPYGTTPEKLEKVKEAKKRGDAAPKAKPVASVPTRGPPSDQVHTSMPKSSTSVFPPMPTSSPTPSSQKISQPFATKTDKKTSNILSGAAGDKQHKDANLLKLPPKKEEKPGPTAFGDMKGFGASLFSLGEGEKSKIDVPSKKSSSLPKDPDYKAILTKFYDKHNPAKKKDIPKTLEKYKGQEKEMFAKLAKKYNDTNPLESEQPFKESSQPKDVMKSTAFGARGESNKVDANASTFGSGLSASGGAFTSSSTSSTPFVGGAGSDRSPFGGVPSLADNSSAKSAGTFGESSLAPSGNPFGANTGASPFGQSSAQSNSTPFGGGAGNTTPFGQPSTTSTTSAFGTSSIAPAPSPFGASTQTNNAPGVSSFGTSGSTSNVPAPSPFGNSTQTINVSAPSPFGPATFGVTPFGAAAPSAFGATTSTPSKSFAGKTPKEMLVAFYQQYNSSKLNTVDQVLQKYQGQEEQLFRNLAKKYNLDPSVFGLSASTPGFSGGGGGFGQPSPLGGGGGFAANSPGPAPSFGTTSTFGNSSTLGASTPSFGTKGSGFGGGGTSSGGFGSLAQQGGSFGSSNNTGSFGGPTPFGSPSGTAASSFGGSPFGGPRR